MKKLLLVIGLLFHFLIYAQNVIFEEEFKKDDVAINYRYIKDTNKIIIKKGKNNEDRLINAAYSFDKNGNKDTLVGNVNYSKMRFWSDTHFLGILTLSNSQSNEAKDGFEYYKDQKLTYLNTNSEGLTKYSKEWSCRTYYLSKHHLFDVINAIKSIKFNIQKDDWFLDVIDLNTNKGKTIPIEKPDMERIINEKAFKYNSAGFKDAAFNIRTHENNFEVITKFINKDFNSSILYRTFYDFEGNKLDDISYPVTLKNDFFIPSDSPFNNNFITDPYSNLYFSNNLPINDFVVDPNNGDVYIHGVFGPKIKKNKISGIYVMKFNKTGKKLWESIIPLENMTGFSALKSVVYLFLNLKIFENTLLLTATSSAHEKYTFYFKLDKSNGEKKENQKFSYSTNYPKGNFITAHCTHDIILKNKNLNPEALILYEINQDFKKYIDSKTDNKDRIYFDAIITPEGNWLIESDNKNYYKILFFTN